MVHARWQGRRLHGIDANRTDRRRTRRRHGTRNRSRNRKTRRRKNDSGTPRRNGRHGSLPGSRKKPATDSGTLHEVIRNRHPGRSNAAIQQGARKGGGPPRSDFYGYGGIQPKRGNTILAENVRRKKRTGPAGIAQHSPSRLYKNKQHKKTHPSGNAILPKINNHLRTKRDYGRTDRNFPKKKSTRLQNNVGVLNQKTLKYPSSVIRCPSF